MKRANLFWIFLFASLLGLNACQTTPTPAPVTDAAKPDPLKALANQNELLLAQNKELAQELENLKKLRETDKVEFNKRLVAMDNTIQLWEKNLDEQAEKGPVAKPLPQKTEKKTDPEPKPAALAAVAPPQETEDPGKQDMGTEEEAGSIPTPVTSLALTSVDLNQSIESDKGSHVKGARHRLPVVLPPSKEVEKKEETQIWDDPDLNPPVFPIKLDVFPAAKKAYNDAFKAYTRKDYLEAAKQFDLFLSRYPNDVDADNAQFWRGMAFFDEGRLDQSEEEFRKVLKNYQHGLTGEGFKSPDAVLMLGKIYLKRQKPIRARYYFEHCVKNYAESRAAHKAQRELDALVEIEAQ
ncbi:MAG: hypothetical protein A2527_05215 [Candidatus Lambdaproteobacteria bacterium RIFOXYD2_FULL_50_16]|uniref:Outer membrane lipoprotein BamD-like domain-containing protein n=1 Tax=Candidatus Lambdaproteobacteria bacterium RIFOXYD2_FULL_50_16 TaxID=1817772 RepID=A0A1F6G8Z3_9PROT|nr:MAG: hypothetical protein A2527_05215 [Candidatus Lambdaproteobacteria bacterium RIFOXYD2_FULL_50_16]